MLHTLLSAVLVAAQLCAAPVYLCLEADGSVCIDFGPAGCDCCRHGPAEPACADETCSHDSHESPAPVASSWFDPCGCVHVQIGEPQSATRERVIAPQQSQTATGAVTASIPSSTAALASGAAESPPPRVVPSATLLSLASVVIRC